MIPSAKKLTERRLALASKRSASMGPVVVVIALTSALILIASWYLLVENAALDRLRTPRRLISSSIDSIPPAASMSPSFFNRLPNHSRVEVDENKQDSPDLSSFIARLDALEHTVNSLTQALAIAQSLRDGEADA